MTPFYREGFNPPCFPIQRQLFLRRGRSGLDGYPEDQFIAIGNTSYNSTCVIGPGPAATVFDRIVMLAPKHFSSRKTGAELDAPYCRYCEYGMCQDGLYRIEERLTQSDGQAADTAFHNTPDRIFRVDGFLQTGFYIGLATDFQYGSCNFDGLSLNRSLAGGGRLHPGG